MNLRNIVAEALVRAEGFEPHPGDIENWVHHADVVLAAIGLDDLDAAVERMADVLPAITAAGGRNNRSYARAALSALLATGGADDE